MHNDRYGCLENMVKDKMGIGQHQKSENGQDLVEFALILPVLLLLLFGIIEFGLIVFSYNTIANTGREVARYGSIHPDGSLIDTYIADNVMGEDRKWGIGMNSDNMDIRTSLADQGLLVSTIHVTVTYTYTFVSGPLIALFTDPAIQLQTTSTMYTESVPVNP